MTVSHKMVELRMFRCWIRSQIFIGDCDQGSFVLISPCHSMLLTKYLHECGPSSNLIGVVTISSLWDPVASREKLLSFPNKYIYNYFFARKLRNMLLRWVHVSLLVCIIQHQHICMVYCKNNETCLMWSPMGPPVQWNLSNVVTYGTSCTVEHV